MEKVTCKRIFSRSVSRMDLFVNDPFSQSLLFSLARNALYYFPLRARYIWTWLSIHRTNSAQSSPCEIHRGREPIDASTAAEIVKPY